MESTLGRVQVGVHYPAGSDTLPVLSGRVTFAGPLNPCGPASRRGLQESAADGASDVRLTLRGTTTSSIWKGKAIPITHHWTNISMTTST